MKKILFALLVLLIAAPAWARVDVWCEQVGDTNEVVVYFDATSEDGNLVRAIAVDLQADGDGVFKSILCVNSDFDVSPGKARGKVNTVTGEIDYDEPNTACLCPDPGPPPGTHPDTKPGLDSNGITIEMATLYEAGTPSMSGELARLRVEGSLFNIVISENVVRGGVVFEDADEPVDVNATGCEVDIGCFPGGHPDRSEWDAVGQPDCWCYPRQCHGDVDDVNQGDEKSGYFYVWSADLGALVSGWKQAYGGNPAVDTWICADFDHAEQGDEKSGYFRVWSADLGILVANWKTNPDPNCFD